MEKTIRQLNSEELHGYLYNTNTESSKKLADVLKIQDLNGSHLEDLTPQEISELCGTMGMKKDLNNLIKKIDSLVITSKPPSISISSSHPSIYASVNKEINAAYQQRLNNDSMCAPPTRLPDQVPRRFNLSSPNGFDLSSLEDGQYDVDFYVEEGYSAPLLLSSHKVSKSRDDFQPTFFDLSTSDINMNFMAYDKPMSNSDVMGELIPSGNNRNNNRIAITAKTDSNGIYKSVVPASHINVQVKGKVDGKEVEIKETYEVLPPKPVTSLTEAKANDPVQFQSTTQCTQYHIQSAKNNIIILCDVSGSMGIEGQMDRLKKTLHRMLELDFIGSKKNIGFAAWNKTIDWGVSPGQWVTEQTVPQIKRWIDNLIAAGGNDMKQAIKSALSLYEGKVNEIIVLCDGDTYPFENESDWVKFIAPHPSIIFSFVAIGATSDHTKMKLMAQKGRGFFNKVD